MSGVPGIPECTVALIKEKRVSSVNKVHLLGRLGRDPEVRYLANGDAVCNLRIATTRTWKNKDSGEKMEETEWTSTVAYGRTAEVQGEYLKKGHLVYIEGRMKTRKWVDKEDIERYVTEIVVENMTLMPNGDRGGNDDRGDNRTERQAPQSTRNGSAREQTQQPERQRPPQQRPQSSGRGATGFDDMDSDIPF